MSVQFNADEIFEMAEQIERNGAKFYRRATEGTAGGPARELLLRLAAMEEEHEQTFVAMRQELTPTEREPITFDPDDQGALYLRALADGYIFDVRTDPAEQLTGQETLEEIFRRAIQAEKDSIVFYLGLKDCVLPRRGQERIDGIIREEMGHIALLSRQLALETVRDTRGSWEGEGVEG